MWCAAIIRRTAYYDPKGLLVTDRRSIAINYVRTWFFLDVVSVM